MDCEEKGGEKHIGEEVEYCGKAGFDQGGRADGGEDLPFWLFYNHTFANLYIHFIFEYSMSVYLFACLCIIDLYIHTPR